MTKKEIEKLAKNQQNLIGEAEIYLDELKYLCSKKETALEDDLSKHRPFTTIEHSFERTLILLYSYLISDRDNDFYRLSKTICGLLQNKRNLESWSLNLKTENLESQLEQLEILRSKTKIMKVRDKVIAHIDSQSIHAIDIEDLDKLHELLTIIKETTLNEISKYTVTVPTILNLKNHMEKFVEMKKMEDEYWKLKENNPRL